MLRTTVSSVKKACSGAFTPRILKGDSSVGPVSYAVVKKSFESTKSTDDGKQDKDKLSSEEDSAKKKSEELELTSVSLEDKSSIQCLRPEEPPSIPLTHRERCQRIIDKAFGACEHTEHNSEPTQKYFSHNINLEVTRREIFESEKAKLKLQEQVKVKNPLLPASRTQYSISKMTGELIEDDNQGEIVLSKDSVLKVPPTVKGPTLADSDDLVKTLNITAAEEPNVTKSSDSAGIAEDNAPFLETYSSNAKEDVEKCMNNPECVENKTIPDDDAEAIEMVKDERKQHLYQKEIPQEPIHTLIPYNKTQFGLLYSMRHEDENQDEIILMDKDKALKLPPVICSQLTGMDNYLSNAEVLSAKCVKNLPSVENKALHDDHSETVEMDKDERKHSETVEMDKDERKHMFINATTAKEDEEKLIQKLETIEETPLVEAQIPKIEGFNVTPRVLGDQPKLNSKSIENDKVYVTRMPVLPSCDLDDVAKRCLNSPLRRVDEILLNEIEKRSITSKTESNAPTKALLGDMLLQMDELKRQKNYSTFRKKEIRSESTKYEMEGEEPSLSVLSPTRHITEKRLPDLSEKTKDITLMKPKDSQQVENTASLKNTELNESIVTKMRVLRIDSVKNVERAPNIVPTKKPVSEKHVENDISKGDQNTQFATDPAETEKTYSRVTSIDSPRDAFDDYMIKYERLQKPDYVTRFKEVDNPSYFGRVNASNYAMDELQSKEANRQLRHSRNLSDRYLCAQKQQNAAASKTKCLQHKEKGGTAEIEHSQTPQGQSMKEEVVKHTEITTNRGLSEGVPYTNFSLPAHKWEKAVEGSQEKSNSKDDPQLKPEQGCVKVSVTDELLKEHELDPYYVLACNETCPIAPITTLSTYNHNDFVDTTETIYMKKNICESIRPKPLPRDVKMASEKNPPDTQALQELDVEFETEVIPESCIPTATPKVKSTDMPDTHASLPKSYERMSLSELLRRVRQRSRLQSISDLKSVGVKVEPTVGKCNRKAPRCSPTAPRSPPNNPVPPPSFGLPMLKRRPPVCPPKKKPSCKCTTCDMDVSCGGQIGGNCPGIAYELNEAEVVAVRSKVGLNEVVVDRVHDLRKAISGVLRQVKSSTETFFARDYDPWAPIPSWPSQKIEKKKWEPAKPCVHGCPVYPKARASMNPDPPCETKPCQGFPKRSYSMLDYFAVPVDDVELK